MRLLLTLFALISAVKAASWNTANSPRQFSSSYEYNFNKLPSSGGVKVSGWSDTYWPSYQGGIAHRWYSANPQDFKYKLYSKEELLAMNSDVNTLMTLSPAEKYDIFVGRYDYPLVYTEWNRTNPENPTWWGICHGWAPAAHIYSEPNPVTLTNADGINVYFGSSDVKALLSWYIGQFDRTGISKKFIGTRCNSDLYANPSAANTASCADLDAGAFHVLLTNQLGKLQEGFVADVDRGNQVWNQPVDSFTFETGTMSQARTTSTAGTVSSVDVSMTMYYTVETYPEWYAHEPYVISRTYSYYLDLDVNGNIIGGEYISTDRIDFAWNFKPKPFWGYFLNMSEVYSKSTGQIFSPFVLNSLTVAQDALFAANHENILESEGEFGLDGYSGKDQYTWSIGQKNQGEYVEITFAFIDVAENFDQITIIEGEFGQGAPVAVLHGKYNSKVVKVQGSTALVRFIADSDASNFKGFKASFKVISSQ